MGNSTRVVLVRPGWSGLASSIENTYNRVWPPLSNLYVLTSLRARGLDARLVDLQAHRIDPERALADLGVSDRVFVCTDDLDRWQCPHVEMAPIDGVAAVLHAKRIPFFLTGPHGTMAPEWLLERSHALGIVKGEPEEAVVALATGVSPRSIPGLVLAGEDGFVDTGDPPSVDVTALPNPDYSLIDLGRYRYELLGDRFALFEGSRGCPYPCAFCSRLLQGRPIRRKGPSQLIAEVERAVKRDRVRSAYFIDLEFDLGRETSVALCEYLARERPPLRWCCQLRPQDASDALLDALAAGGCCLVHCGIETGSDQRARQIHKVARIEEMLAGVERILARGMDVLCFFILGFPGESEAEIERTIRIAMRINPTYASFHLFTPYPGSEFSVPPSGSGPYLVPPSHPAAPPLERLNALRRSAYLRFYLRPRYFLSRLARRDYASLVRQVRLFVSQVLS